MTKRALPTTSAYVPPQRIGFRPLSEDDTSVYLEIARRALDHFDLRDRSIKRLVRHTNVTAKVVSRASGRGSVPALALRMRTGPAVSALTELTWLLAVRRSTDISTVEPYGTSLAETTVEVVHPVDDTSVECSLFVWADGDPLAQRLDLTTYRRLGRLSAALHEFSSGWLPPADLDPLRWDRTMYYGTQLVVADRRFSSFLNESSAARILRIVQEADAELARINDRPDRMYLHGNVEMWNVLVDRTGALRLLDFEDVMYGHPILDIAITLFYGQERRDYPDLVTAFREGYASVREWPATDPRQLRLLMAARATMLLNHALLTEPDPARVAVRLVPVILDA